MGPEDERKQGRGKVSTRGAAEDAARTPPEEAARTSPEDDWARRYLDLWERNLSFLALNGPVPGESPPKR